MNTPEIEFVERTKEILNNVETPHEVSLMINCTFGLILFPHLIILKRLNPKDRREWWNESDYWKQDLKDLPNLPDFIRQQLNINHFPKTVGEFIHKLRNALSHQQFTPINVNGKFVGIRFIIVRNINLSFELVEANFKEALTFIADTYLNFLNEQNQ